MTLDNDSTALVQRDRSAGAVRPAAGLHQLLAALVDDQPAGAHLPADKARRFAGCVQMDFEGISEGDPGSPV